MCVTNSKSMFFRYLHIYGAFILVSHHYRHMMTFKVKMCRSETNGMDCIKNNLIWNSLNFYFCTT